MGEGFIVRRGGASQTLAPTITEISTSESTIVFTLTNNDTESAVILYETNDTVPDENSIELAGGATSGNLTISGLTVSPAILYASANVVGKVKSNITERSFTFAVPIYTAAIGGTTTEYNDGGKRYKSHTFTSNGTFEVTAVGNSTASGARDKIEYVIVAGGGGQGASIFTVGGGAAGAGGYRSSVVGEVTGTNLPPEPRISAAIGTYPVVIGAGASGGTSQGSPSSIFGISSTGGGSGVGGNNTGNTGGSGSAPSRSEQSANFTGFAGISGQGNKGGNTVSASSNFSSQYSQAGGGGAGGVGGNSTAAGNYGAGGPGIQTKIRTGQEEFYAGGGGSPGGVGGGGNGITGQSGAINTGGGAASASWDWDSAGATGTGGSGIVIVRYEIAPSV